MLKTLEYRLKPHWDNDTVTYMWVYGTIDATTILDDGPGLNYCCDAWGNLVPFATYDELAIEDDLGAVPYELKPSPSNWGGINYKGFYFQRPLEGTLRWRYRIYPRVLPEGYSASPYYDFRNEPYGLNFSGAFAFILPDNSVRFNFSLIWDMDEMPEEARGVWSLGTGNVEKELCAWDVRFSYFACGIMNVEEVGDFGIYWFGETPFNIRSVTKRLSNLFVYMANFFKDDNPVYRIFLRRDPFEKSGGGSGALRSFMSGYSAFGEESMDMERWFCILAHEMVHNWPMGDDSVTGTMTWYMEGMAEYYSAVLPFRAGLVDAAYTVNQLNDKGKVRYLDNIYREVPNMDLPKIQWQDRRAQTVAYGRGFVYLSNVEAQLRRAGNGSIDEISPKYLFANPMKESDWIAFIREKLGEEAVQEFENMKAGELQIPDPDAFGDVFTVVEDKVELDGKIVKTYKWVLR